MIYDSIPEDAMESLFRDTTLRFLGSSWTGLGSSDSGLLFNDGLGEG